MIARVALALGLLALVSLGASACGSGDGGAPEAGGGGAADPGTRRPAPAERAPERVDVPPCPAAVADCRRVSGRIVYVERVDPDGDGDAHFVIAERPGVTLPGLTAIDVRAGLRPHPLPGPGDLVAAAGPVQTGSYDQSQVHALALAVGRPVRR